jgi:hypothetical protein
VRTDVTPSSFPLCRGEPPCPGAAARPSSGAIFGRQWPRSTMDWPFATVHELRVHSFLCTKIILFIPGEMAVFHKTPCHFYKSTHHPFLLIDFTSRPLYFLQITFLTLCFYTEALQRVCIYKYVAKTFQKFQFSPRTSFNHMFSTVTLISVILAPKFSESLSLSLHAFIIHVYCILSDCVPHVS